MGRSASGILAFLLTLATVLSFAQSESVANASVVLSMCQVIASKTARELQQQQRQLLFKYQEKTDNVVDYVQLWGARLINQGANSTNVKRCVTNFNETVNSRRELTRNSLQLRIHAYMESLDAVLFSILTKDLSPQILEKYVEEVKGISKNVLATAQNEFGAELQYSVNVLKSNFQKAGNCLRGLMIKDDSIFERR